MTISAALFAEALSIPSIFWLVFSWRARVNVESSISVKDLTGIITQGIAWPKVSVIVPARNEEHSIARSLESLLAQDYPSFEVVVVNDRSTDGTGQTVKNIAMHNPAVRLLEVDALPADWMGKPHALQKGVEASSGDWIVFTDADIIWGNGVLRKTVGYMLESRIEFVTIAVEPLMESLSEKLFLMATYAVSFVSRPPWKVADPRNRLGFGVGAFCLFRRHLFNSISGMSHLKLSIPSDMALGDAAKRNGFRCRLFFGKDAIWCRWQSGIGGLIRGVEKNFFPGSRFNYFSAFILLILIFGVTSGPLVGLILALAAESVPLALLHFSALCGVILFGHDYMGQLRARWYHIVLLPVGGFYLSVALIWSIVYTVRNRGVGWRDTLYPRTLVLEHMKERDRWLESCWSRTHG